MIQHPTDLSRRPRQAAVLLATLLLATCATRAAAEGSVDARAVFERLKSLAGTWGGMPEASGDVETEPELRDGTRHEFRLAAAGTAVMETMGAGTDHEMINLYHLDGDDLLVTHYCAGGNQPRMRLDREHSSPSRLVFEFLDATNLDPDTEHIREIEIRFAEDGRLESAWRGFRNGAPTGVMTFHLARSGGQAASP